jgi:hypothetical protein
MPLPLAPRPHLNLPLLRAHAALTRFLEQAALLHVRLAHAVAVIVIACKTITRVNNQIQHPKKSNSGAGRQKRTVHIRPTQANARRGAVTVIILLNGNIGQQFFLRNLVFCNTNLHHQC